MYTIKMSITDEQGREIDFTKLYYVANRGAAFALMAEWSNFLKQSIKSLIDKQNQSQKRTHL